MERISPSLKIKIKGPMSYIRYLGATRSGRVGPNNLRIRNNLMK
jgi:hypothetical protein